MRAQKGIDEPASRNSSSHLRGGRLPLVNVAAVSEVNDEAVATPMLATTRRVAVEALDRERSLTAATAFRFAAGDGWREPGRFRRARFRAPRNVTDPDAHRADRHAHVVRDSPQRPTGFPEMTGLRSLPVLATHANICSHNTRTELRALPVVENAPMRVSAKADYAVRAMVELAASPARRSARQGRPARRRAGDPERFLENILAELRVHGLVQSRRGAKGGYWLGDAGEITIAEIIRAVEGPLATVRGESADELDYRGSSAPLSRYGSRFARTFARCSRR